MKTLVWITVFFALGVVIGFFLAVYMLTRRLDKQELDAEAAQRYIDQRKDKHGP